MNLDFFLKLKSWFNNVLVFAASTCFRMGSRLELRKSSSQRHNSRIGKEEVVILPQSKRCPCPTVPDRLKMKSPVRPRTDLHCVSTKVTNVAREKSSMYWKGKSVEEESTIGEDELVRYMSNLPGYLLRADRGENLQEKAFLNVGVLDWTRLENWKHKQIRCPTKGKDNLVQTNRGPSHFSRVTRCETSYKSCSSHKEERSHCRVSSVRNATHSQDFDSGSKSVMKGRQNIQRTCTSSSSGGNDSNMMDERVRKKCSDRKPSSEMVDVSSHVRHSGVLPCPKSTHVLGSKANHRTEKPIETIFKKKEADERMGLGVGDTLSKSSYDHISLGLNDHMNAENDETKKREGKQCTDIDLPSNYFTYKQDDNFLLKQKPKNLDAGFQPLYSRTSFDENMTDVNSCSYSEIFSPSECGSDIPYSCPLPSLADIDPMMGRMQDSLVCDTSAELSCSSSQVSPYSKQKPRLRPSGGKQIENGDSDIKLTHSDLVHTLETLDDKTPDPGATKGRHPSPIRRLSFSLGRMGRSFSFKESSTVPHLSSTSIPKSGPVIYENNSDRKKVNGHNRTRSSPLRRLIEPLLKHKSSNPRHPIEGSVDSLSLWPTGPGSGHQKKNAESTMQALLQFTIKNGFPLFKLLVDNNRNILAATATDLTPSGKNESGQNYTFYLVNEIKRSGGWIRPGNRDKSYGYAYNVIGQMKVNSDYETNEHSNGKYMLRESVLFGVEMRPGDRESAILVKNRELAAIVLKIPTENLKHDGQQTGNVLIDNCMESLSGDNGVVILPGAVHGSPSNGEPSPLINRWRSGGVCDCGGWDVGCKLRILSIPNKLITSKACPISKCLQLFVEGDEQDKPIFSMAPLKGGFFEVRFDSSISMLQAFFICVAVLNGQKPADPSEASKFAPDETMIKYPDSKGINTVLEKQLASIRYAPNPPHSPVGRV